MTILSEVISTKRSPTVSSGKRGSPVVYLTDIASSPLDPVSPEVALRVPGKAPHELLQVFVLADHDIREGDILVDSNGKEYPIKSVAEWKWPIGNTMFLHLVLEDLK